MKYAKQLLLILTLALLSDGYAQDGEGLFKAKCNTCHMLGKNSVGPDLKGIKQKWNDAGEGDNLYSWVLNSAELISTGNSQLALKVKEFSPTEMPAQAVSKEEIDAILDFVDSWKPVVVTDPTPTGDPIPVTYVPDYNHNLYLFYTLIAMLIIQIFGIFILGNSLTTIIKRELLKSKSSKGLKTIALIIGSFVAVAAGNSMYALEFVQPGATTEQTPWLLVEDRDVYFMVILNVLALGVLLYMRKSFMEMIRTIRPETATKRLKRKQRRRVNQILTDVVPIEEEHTILMQHEYDGIRELDNNLPPWWVWGFYATIVFAIVYMFNYHILGVSDLQIEEYNKEMARAEKEVAAYLDKMAMNVDENTVVLLNEPGDLSAGKAIYDANCVACHNPNGEGNIGPNITDNNWIYGFDIKTVFGTIKNGTSKGMPEHDSKLNPVQLQQVASYVLSMPAADGKAPEGEILRE